MRPSGVDLDGLARVRAWLADHPLLHGLGEMAIGATILAWGVQSGAIEMGAQLVGLDAAPPMDLIGAGIGGSVGAVGAYLIGNIGGVAAGSAVGVPAGVLAAGGALILSLAGRGAGDFVQDAVLEFDPASLVAPGAALFVGVGLLIDGARRVCVGLGDLAGPWLDSRGLHLPPAMTRVLAWTVEELRSLNAAKTIGLTSLALAGGGLGTIVGAPIAAGSVTVLGSKAIGGLALSLGLVSAPLWPVVACGVAGVAISTALGVGLIRGRGRASA